jgi:flagellar biogenesis protein FliO
MTELVLQMIAALAFVVLLIFLMAFVYRKRGKGAGLISLVSYQSIGQKMGVAAVKIGGEIFVLGVTPTDFKLLKRIEGGAAGTESPDGQKDDTSFMKVLRTEKGDAPARRDRVAETIEKIRGLRGEIDG